MKTYGRKTIYANYTEAQLLSGTPQEIAKKVIDILANSIDIHNQNAADSKYLYDYLYGDQDIKDKEKYTRPEINNKGVENWAYAFMDWKKAFLLGKPIQYATKTDVSNDEITTLNNYLSFENKGQLDQEIYEDIFATGRGFRYVNYSGTGEDDEAPIELLNLDFLNTEVVYSSSIEHEQLLTYAVTDKQYITSEANPETGKPENRTIPYEEYTVYTRNMKFVISNKSGQLQLEKQTYEGKKVDYVPIIHNAHIIQEWYLNRKRMSFLEICKDIFDDINKIEALDMDDFEGHTNSIMVFTNAEVNKEGMDAIKQYGAVSIKSTDQKKASVELLENQLVSVNTQIYYLRKLAALHAILSVPQASQSGEISNAETGKAMLVGSGFTSASIRVETEENEFKKCDRNSMKVILKILRNASDSKIKNLKVSDIDFKFSRDLSDNLLVKTQALMNLRDANIPPEVANAVIGLFSDPNAVTKLQEAYMKRKQELENQINEAKNNNNNINKQNNEIQDTTSVQEQGQ